MITILISAKQGAGKTTLADALAANLTKCGRTRFAKPLYEMHDAVLNILNRYIDGQRLLDKRLLQLIGTEWGRNTVAEDIWIQCFIKEQQRMSAAGMNFLVADDCRFKNELESVEAIKIRLECDRDTRKARCSQWRDTENHQSETDLDDWVDKFDLVIDTAKHTPKETLKIVMEFINGKVSSGSGAGA
jgi:phosphomevalonate kinase